MRRALRDAFAPARRRCVVEPCQCGVRANDGNFVIVDSEIRGADAHGVARLGGQLAGVVAGSRVVAPVAFEVYLKGQDVVRGSMIEDAGDIARRPQQVLSRALMLALAEVIGVLDGITLERASRHRRLRRGERRETPGHP